MKLILNLPLTPLLLRTMKRNKKKAAFFFYFPFKSKLLQKKKKKKNRETFRKQSHRLLTSQNVIVLGSEGHGGRITGLEGAECYACWVVK